MRALFLLPLLVHAFGATAQLDDATRRDSVLRMTASRPVAHQLKRTWDFGGVHFSNRFAGARLNEVERVNDTAFVCTIAPENRPVNGSPWYAFAVRADEPRWISVTLRYTDFFHRYHPKISLFEGEWHDLPDSLLHGPDTLPHAHPGQTGDTILLHEWVRMDLWVDTLSLTVAAQQVIDVARDQRWWMRLEAGGLTGREAAPVEGTPYELWAWHAGQGPNSLLLLGRQHPPEVTGALALRQFMLRLLEDDELATRFRTQWRVTVIPLMNPTGVDGGHWRHNGGGVDINRDWWLMQQPETRAASTILERNLGGRNYLIDFHSTWKDILYPQDSTANDTITPGWLDRFDALLGTPTPRRQVPFFAPITSLHWAQAHGIPAVVYEVGDDTPEEELDRKARLAAEAVMHALLGDRVGLR